MMRYLILAALLLCLPVRGEAWQVVATGASTPAITYESTTTGMTATTTLTIDTPANTADGDLLIAIINDDSASGITATGWTPITTLGVTSDLAHTYYKIASSEGANQSFAISTAQEACGAIMRMSKTGGEWTIGTASTDISSPFSVTAIAAAGSVLVLTAGSDDANSVSTPPADMTEAAWVKAASSRAGIWYQAITATGDYTKEPSFSGVDQALSLFTVSLSL